MSKGSKARPLKEKILKIFTDGACKNNGKSNALAGIGVYFPNKEYKDISKPFVHPPITNQRAELYAIYKAVKAFRDDADNYTEIIIYTDSNYSIKCLTEWVKSWIKNNWNTSGNKKVMNRDIIKPLYEMIKKYKQIKFIHVRSHTGKQDELSLGNSVADDLAVNGANKTKV
jgi:ribonuclease HI